MKQTVKVNQNNNKAKEIDSSLKLKSNRDINKSYNSDFKNNEPYQDENLNLVNDDNFLDDLFKRLKFNNTLKEILY